MHTTRTMSLHYLVKHKYLKTNKNWTISDEVTTSDCMLVVFPSPPGKDLGNFFVL